MSDVDKLLDEDIINYLQKTPSSNVTLEKRCYLKDKRPTPSLSIKQSCKGGTRTWQSSWYERYKWISGCSKKQKMFCYVCLLFGEKDNEWCINGTSDLSNFIKKANKHASSRLHLQYMESFVLLGKVRIEHVLSEAARTQAVKHNQLVASNREILKRIIQSIIFLAKQELAFRGHKEDADSNNRGNFLELLELLALNESTIREHLQSSSSFKGTSPDIQNDLIEVITSVLNETIKSEINEAPFVSVQADETLDVSCKSQMDIILRYCIEDRIEERFIGFYEVSKDKAAESLANVILNVLKDWDIDVTNKLISQTYDGANVMAGRAGGVQSFIKKSCPQALFIHCYAHQLNLVLLHGSKSIRKIKLFVCALTAFHSFFSKSSKRTVLLTEQGFKLPQASNTRWNFHSRAVQTIKHHFQELYIAISSIVEDENSQWDCDSINCAIGLKRHLDSPSFVFLLCVYDACFTHIEPLMKLLQSSSVSIVSCHNEIRQTIRSLENMRKSDDFVNECIKKSVILNMNLQFPGNEIKNATQVCYELLDSQIVQMNERFKDFESLQFTELVNEQKFGEFKTQFPVTAFNSLFKTYNFFVKEKLYNELINVYSDDKKALQPKNLLKYLVANGLDAIYEEVTKLLRLILTLPATTASSERSMSTLKRVKTYLRNSMTNARLSNFSSLAIEKALLRELSSDPVFIERCIDVFAEKKKRRIELMYKVV